jgi:hypothetical protein
MRLGRLSRSRQSQESRSTAPSLSHVPWRRQNGTPSLHPDLELMLPSMLERAYTVSSCFEPSTVPLRRRFHVLLPAAFAIALILHVLLIR